MANRFYTILIVPERSSKVRRLKIPHRRLVQAVMAMVLLIGLAGFLSVHYLFVIDQASQHRALKNENVLLKAKLRLVQEEIARIDGTLQRIDHLSTKIRSITQLNDPERDLAIGPLVDEQASTTEVLYAHGERINDEDEEIGSKLAMRIIDAKAESLEGEALRQESNVRELRDYFNENEVLLATTPSIRPVQSDFFTSTFGMRNDPYTNHRVLHKGLDLAAEHGSDIMAPADAVVIFVGHRGEYGKTVVLDHGFGMQTHYAHLSNYKVEVGQKVLRGQVIGAVGKTGRTTGVHLHYEVRLNGIPQDPERFILD